MARQAASTWEGGGINEPLQVVFAVFVQNAALIVATLGVFWAGVLTVRLSGRRVGYSPAPLGLARPRSGALMGVGIGLAVGVGALLLSFMLNPLSSVVLDRFGYPSRNTQGPFLQTLTEWVQQSPGVAIPTIFFVVVILGPIAEELFFRGAIFGGLYRLGSGFSARMNGDKSLTGAAEKVSFALAALASSVIFALLHGSPVIFATIFILALVLCALYRKTGSLLPSMVTHATFNSFTTGVVILSGLGVFEMPVQTGV